MIYIMLFISISLTFEKNNLLQLKKKIILNGKPPLLVQKEQVRFYNLSLYISISLTLKKTICICCSFWGWSICCAFNVSTRLSVKSANNEVYIKNFPSEYLSRWPSMHFNITSSWWRSSRLWEKVYIFQIHNCLIQIFT